MAPAPHPGNRRTPRLQFAHHPDRPDRRTPVLEDRMRDWPPYCMDGSDDDIDPAVLTTEVDHFIAALGLAPPCDPGRAEIEDELNALLGLRDDHRSVRRTITASWIVVCGLAAALYLTGRGWLALLLAPLAVVTWQLHAGVDVSRARGRELDADIADARARLDGTGER